MNYQQSLAAVGANKDAFTHVSPSLYQLNYDYSSGVAGFETDGSDNFDGLSSSQIASRVHGMGMKCVPLIQAGAGNGGTDQGIQNVISNGGTQSAFISAMVQEAVNKGYDGYSLDWETGGGTTYSDYGPGMTSFLGAFASALHAHGKILQLIVGDWYVQQSNCSGGQGFVDLQAAAAAVDQVIVMDYEGSLGNPTTSCNASVGNPGNCGSDFGSDLNLMCAYVPLSKISIGLDSDPNGGNNPIAGACVSATQAANIPAVAIWPEYNTRGPNGSYLFCDTTNISPPGTTWFALLSGFLSGQ
jgi:spore germination protein YaaH